MRSAFWFKSIAVLAGMLVLAGCPGEKSDPQPQEAAPRVESTGIVDDGVSLRKQDIVGKGASGATRRTDTDASGAFVLNMAGLTGPYLFSNTLSTGNPELIFLLGLQTRVGHTNVTPLTTLLVSQLLGVTPVNAFQTYNTTLPKDRITGENIKTAQADLTAYLQDALGVQVRSGDASFIDSPFEPNVGDPMYDTILALNAKIAADGTSLSAVAERIATGAQACLTEQLQITIDGQTRKFCPVARSDIPEEADTTILDYTFRDIANAMLLVKARGDTVLSVYYTTPANVTYSCSAAACAGVSLGTVAADESRPIVFGSLALTGSGSGALLAGTLTGPPPSIELPVLPCADNRFFLIVSNNSAVGDCVRPEDPFQLGASVGGPQTVGRDSVNVSGQSFGSFSIVVDSVSPEHPAVSVYYRDSDPETSESRYRFLCRFAECNGLTWGSAEPVTTSGFPLETRKISLDKTMMVGINDDGTPNGLTATLSYSGVAVFQQNYSFSYPPLMDCDPTADTVSVGAFNGEFNLCLPAAADWRSQFDQGNGFVQIALYDDVFNQVVSISLLNGGLDRLSIQPPGIGETYSCTTDCAGVTVNGPDADGQYVVSFSRTVVHRDEAFPLPSDRTLTLTSGDIVIPPPPF
jgi:hypothetical protein